MSSLALLPTMAIRGLARLLDDRRGATAIEYGMIAALIALAIMSTVFAMGQGINQTFYGAVLNALSGP